MNDFVSFPRRIKRGEELCICMHKELDHHYLKEKYCKICMCEEFKKSKMNGKIDNDIEIAKFKAESQWKIPKKLPSTVGKKHED